MHIQCIYNAYTMIRQPNDYILLYIACIESVHELMLFFSEPFDTIASMHARTRCRAHELFSSSMPGESLTRHILPRALAFL